MTSLLTAALLAAGCASLPSPPAVSPGLDAKALAAWREANSTATEQPDAAALAQWWRQFGDAGLSTLMDAALARNTDLRVAQANLREARAARAAAEAGAKPVVGTSASASRSATRSSASNQFQLGFNASWEPDLSGAQAATVSAASASAEAAEADLGTARMSVAAELGLAYVQWRGAQSRLRITQASLDSLEQTYELARWKAQAGLASGLDVEQALLNLAQTRASVPMLANEIAQYEHDISVLCGRSPAEAQGLLPAAAELPQPGSAVERISLGLPADLLRRRPDLRAAEADVRAAWAGKEQTRRAGWPGVSLNGSIGLQALTLASLGTAGAGVAAIAASVDWTIFDGGQRAALVEQQDAALERSRATYDATLLAALKDVEDSLVALRTSRDRLVSLQAAVMAADSALRWTRVRHESGLADFDTLLEAQRNLLSTRLSMQATQTDLSSNLIRVYKALGGGWNPDEPVPAAVAQG